MRILFLTDNFPPETNAPASRTYEHAKEWVRKGHTVTILTGVPNFPTGQVFAGYRNHWYQTETMDGIQVVRVKTYITANHGFIKRTLDYLSFMISSFVFGLWQIRPDVLVATSPQFFTTVSGWLLSVFFRCRFVFEVRDLWPESIVAVGAMQPGFWIRMLEKMELFLYARASAMVTVTHAFKENLIRRGVEPTKIHVVLNGVNVSLFQRKEKPSEQFLQHHGIPKKQFIVGYLGTHGMAHGLDSVLKTAEILSQSPDITFLLVGDGAEKQTLRQMAHNMGLQNVKFLDSIPKHSMPDLWSALDITLVPLKNLDTFRSVIPSKIFEAMAMQVPMVVSLPTGETTNMVQNLGTGMVVEPEAPDTMASAIQEMKENPALLATFREHCAEHVHEFDRANQAEKMLKVLSDR